MIVYRYKLNNYIEVASEFARMVGAPWLGHTFDMPESLGKLHIEVYDYPENFSLSFLCSNTNYESLLVRIGTDNDDLLSLDFYLPRNVTLSEQRGKATFTSKLKCGGYFGTANYKRTVIIPPNEIYFQFCLLFTKTFAKKFFEFKEKQYLYSLMALDSFLFHQEPSKEIIKILTDVMISFEEGDFRKQYAYGKAIELCSLFFNSLEKNTEIYLKEEEAKALLNMQNEIKHNPKIYYTDEYVAEKTGIFLDRLKLLIFELYGNTISQFVIKTRMDKALSYFNKKKSIEETAKLLGYKSIEEFSKLFKQTFGFEPQEYLQ
ncbi:MAG: helix-turn-helix domain-containing protein [Bacteroidales bacterium]